MHTRNISCPDSDSVFTFKGGISVTGGVEQIAAKQTLAVATEEAVSSGSPIPLEPPPTLVLASTRGSKNTDQIATSAPIPLKKVIVDAEADGSI